MSIRFCIVFFAALSVASALPYGTLHERLGGWPACDPTVAQYSGYFSVNVTRNKNYFFWGFSSRTHNVTAPIVIYLNGGPGCSSLLPMLAGNIGACNIAIDGTMTRNPFSWNKEANAFWVDQPAGVGYSFGDGSSDHNEAEVAEDMYNFVQALYRTHSEWKNNELFVVGVSYGGHYAPALAHRIWRGNNHKEGLHIALKGVGVGNGLTNAYMQYPSFPEMAYGECKRITGKPCVSSSVYEQMKAAIPTCENAIAKCTQPSANQSAICADTFQYCNDAMLGPYQQTGLNFYDIRNESRVDFVKAIQFLNDPAVMKALGVRVKGWEYCNDTVYKGFAVDWFQNFARVLPDILSDGVRVLIFVGEDDYICNHLGNMEWMKDLKWSGNAAFNNKTLSPWLLGGKPVGLVKTVSTPTEPLLFTYLRVFRAGHLIASKQPAAAQEMLSHLLKGTTFTNAK